MAEAKGTIYLSAAKFVEARFGESAVRACLDEMSNGEREALGQVLAIGWHPLEPMIEFTRVLDRLFGQGDLALVYELGRFSAEWQLSSLHKMLLRVSSPSRMVTKAGQVWGRYHRSGRWEVEEAVPDCVIGRPYDFEVSDACFCRRQLGWLSRAVELSGGDEVEVAEPRCTARGDAYCEYVGRWRA